MECLLLSDHTQHMEKVPVKGRSTAHQTIESSLTSVSSLTLSPDARFLFAVNTGSNSISSFIVSDNGKLILVDVKPSGRHSAQ